MLAAIFLTVCILLQNPYVSDSAKAVSAETEAFLEKQLASLEQQEGIELVVVIVASLEGKSIGEVSQDYFNRLQVGHAKRDSGILLLIAPKERDSFIDLGYGLGDYITEEKGINICQKVINPLLANGKVDEATKEGVKALFQAMGKTFGKEGAEGGRSIYTTTSLLMFLLSIPLLYLIARFAPSRFFFISPFIGFLTGLTQSIGLAIVLGALGGVMVLICYILKHHIPPRLRG